LQHIEHEIPPDGNPPIYQWHKYWGRKPHNVVRQFIESYCPAGGVVLDPFVGSGVTAIEALRSNRRAVVCDLNPISADILLATVAPPSALDFHSLASRIRELLASKVTALYDHRCCRCGNAVTLLAAAMVVEPRPRPTQLRYKCACSSSLISERAADPDYYAPYSKRLDSEGVWWPDIELAYPNGLPFQKRERYERYRDLFSDRNLLALSYVWDVVENHSWTPSERRLLATLFRSIVHLCSRVSGDRRVRPTSSGWTQHSFWFAKTPVEINVWNVFDRKLDEYEVVSNDWQNKYSGLVRIGRDMEEVFAGSADLFVATTDCATFLKEISSSRYRADYVFTDPPYNGSIQYGELSTMWNAWRSEDDQFSYLETIQQNEVTENTKQGKSLPDYHQRMRTVFSLIGEAIKQSAYAHVTFSSPKVRHRDMILQAARLAGLDFQELHFQRSVRVSKKAIDQPLGSVFGDFILRMVKSV